MKQNQLVMSCSALVLAIGGITNASAATQPRIINSGPVTACQAALPVFDGKIRKRPLAVVNEGTSNAFVTCSFTTIGPSFFNRATMYELYVSNTGNTNQVDITCTAVGGVEGGVGGNTPQFDTRTTTLDAGEIDSFTYIPGQFQGNVLPAVFSISCNLAPNMAVHDMYVQFDENIGN